METVGTRVREGWLHEVQRDVMALGGVVFYVLVIARSLVGPYWDLLVPLLVFGGALLLAYPLLRAVDLYLTRGLLVAVLTSYHYDDPVFAVFAGAIYVVMIGSAIGLGRPRDAIARGVALGVVVSVIGWVLAGVAE